MKAKDRIEDGNFYNFDEIGFTMGAIGAVMVATCTDQQGRSKPV